MQHQHPARRGHRHAAASILATHSGLRPRAWLGIAGLTVVMSLPPPALAADAASPASRAETKTYDIPAGPLEATLNRFGREAGLLLSYPTELTAGLSSPGLRGSYSAEDGLALLLQGTGLAAQAQPGGAYSLVRHAAASPAAAPPPPPAQAPIELTPVTVLGSRDIAVPLANVPASISVIDRPQIQATLATAGRIEDAIQTAAPGFNPTNNGVRQIRGRTAQVFINGVPMNEQMRASAGADINLLAPDQIERVEVARGANSAYGFGSPGGIIALSTPRAESDELSLQTKLGSSINTRHAGSSAQTSLYQSAAQIRGAFDYHVGLSLRRDGFTYDPDGNRSLDFSSPFRQSNAKDDFYDLDASLGYDLGHAGNLRLALTAGQVDVREAYDSDFAGTYREIQSTMVRTPAGDANQRRYDTIDLVYENAHVGSHQLKVEAFGSNVRTKAFEAFDGATFLDAQTNSYRGIRSSLSTTLDSITKGTTVTYGLDWLSNRYFRPYTNATTGETVTFFAPDVTQQTLAPYLQGQVPIGDWRFSAGVRHERYRGHVETAVGSGGIEGGDIEPFNLSLLNAGAVYALTKERELYASFSQGAEVTQLGRAARDAGSAANVKSQPAKSDQYEIGMRQRGEPLDYTLAAFYTHSDLISALQCDGLNPCTPLREPRKFWGIEGTLNWQATAQWKVGGTLAWLDGLRTLENGETRRIGSRDAPPLLVTGYAEFTPREGWRNRVQVDYRASRNPFGDSTDYGEGRVDSLWLVHASTTLDLGPGQLEIGVRNLFDRKYFSIPVQADNTGFYWIPEQGRRISLGYAMKW